MKTLHKLPTDTGYVYIDPRSVTAIEEIVTADGEVTDVVVVSGGTQFVVDGMPATDVLDMLGFGVLAFDDESDWPTPKDSVPAV